MRRTLFLVLALAGTLAAAATAGAASLGEIIPETTAARYGLTRPWFMQVHVDRARGRVSHILLHAGTLFVQTDRGMVHALDAETGETLWSAQVGRRDHPSLAPAANDNLLAVVNGSSLYIVNRFSGKLLWTVEIEGAPGAGPALSHRRAYVPTLDGLVYSYRTETLQDPAAELGIVDEGELTEEKERQAREERRDTIRLRQEYIPPLACQSTGNIFLQPVVTRQTRGEEMAVWATDRNFLFCGRVNHLEENHFVTEYRMEVGAPIEGRPTYVPARAADSGEPGTIYVTSRDGFVYAIFDKDGALKWRFSTGESILQPPAVAGGRVYVATQLGGMYCLDAETGQQYWWAPNVLQFVSASQKRVYVVDELDQLLTLNVETGARLATLPIPQLPFRLLNMETDRVYLASRFGVIQCLHEIELEEPLRHQDVLPPEEGPEEVQQEGFDAAAGAGEEPAGPAEPEEPAEIEPPRGGGFPGIGGDPLQGMGGGQEEEGGGDANPFAPGGGAPGGAAPGGGAPAEEEEEGQGNPFAPGGGILGGGNPFGG